MPTGTALSLRLRPLPGVPHRAVLQVAADRFLVAVGRNGISHRKREGDGATPAGRLHPLGVLYRGDRVAPPSTALPIARIKPGDGWCDDPLDPDYNRFVRLPHRGGHEDLARADHLYDTVVVLDWNTAPRRPGLGSAIFLHLVSPDFGPTAGCIAVTPRVMRRLLAVMDEDSEIVIG